MRVRHSHRLLTALVVLGMLAAAAPAAAAEPIERPFQEELTGHLVDLHMPPDEGQCSAPSLWVSTTEGTGVISHLGRVTWMERHCFKTDGTFGDVELVITAANGDQVFGTFAGGMTGPTTFAETLTITGGTGRFTDASGTVDETGRFDPDTGYMEITGSGFIVYHASNPASHD